MTSPIDPGLRKDLAEAKAAVARHGIVIIRTIETEFEPAVMADARDSMASSPRKLADLSDEELDDLAERLRKEAMRSAKELGRLYTRLLSKLGTEYIEDLARDLEGIGELFRWERIREAAKPASEILQAKGFRGIDLTGPQALSENMQIELTERWPAAFERFALLVNRAVEEIEREKAEEGAKVQEKRKRAKKGG